MFFKLELELYTRFLLKNTIMPTSVFVILFVVTSIPSGHHAATLP